MRKYSVLFFPFIIIICFLWSSCSPAFSTIDRDIVGEEDVKLQKYSPEVEYGHIPLKPTAESGTQIYAKFIDKYGEILNATLSYSIDEHSVDRQSLSNHTRMELIDGDYSNGTFLGIIPSQQEKYYGGVPYLFRGQLRVLI